MGWDRYPINGSFLDSKCTKICSEVCCLSPDLDFIDCPVFVRSCSCTYVGLPALLWYSNTHFLVIKTKSCSIAQVSAS